jgi:hypothetical protein
VALDKVSKSGYHSPTQFESTAFFNRYQDYQMKKEKDLEEMRKAEEEKKYQKLKQKPDINQKSKQIAIENSHKPIY